MTKKGFIRFPRRESSPLREGGREGGVVSQNLYDCPALHFFLPSLPPLQMYALLLGLDVLFRGQEGHKRVVGQTQLLHLFK